MIHFKGVFKAFGPRKVLDSVSFHIKEGEIAFVIGKSGMGKSVILKHIVGLIRPDAGEIWVENNEVSRLVEQKLFSIRKRVGMVFQYPALLDSLTIFENIAFGLRAHGHHLSEEVIQRLVREKLVLVNLREEILGLTPPLLSYGMQKRVSLARTLVLDPTCLLFDEPTTGLDPVNTNSINDLILKLSRSLKVTSIVVSHDMHCALQIADRILLLDQAKIIANGTAAEMVFSQEALVKEFMREAKEKRYGRSPTD